MTDKHLNNDLREFYENSIVSNKTPFDELTYYQICQIQDIYDTYCMFKSDWSQLVLIESHDVSEAAYTDLKERLERTAWAKDVLKKSNDKDLFDFLRKNAPRKTPKRSKIIKRIKK